MTPQDTCIRRSLLEYKHKRPINATVEYSQHSKFSLPLKVDLMVKIKELMEHKQRICVYQL